MDIISYCIALTLLISFSVEMRKIIKIIDEVRTASSIHFTCKNEKLQECCDINSISSILFAESAAIFFSAAVGTILSERFSLTIALVLGFLYVLGAAKWASAFYINLKAKKIKRDFYPPRPLD